MIHIVAGFIVLAAAISGVAVLIASVVLAFFENARPAWRYRTVTKVAASLSLCYGSNLFLYCAEVAPSLIFGSPVYGNTFHTAASWVEVAGHYGSVLHIFLLSVFKIDHLFEHGTKKQHASWIANAAVICVWITAGGLSVLVIYRVCSYTFSVDKIVYGCENASDSKRFVIIYVTLSGVFLLVSALLIAYRYLSHTETKESKPENESSLSDLTHLRKGWSGLLGNELLLAGAKVVIVAVATAMTAKMDRWHGLAVTVLLILFDVLALWLYFRALTHSLQIYVRVEGQRRQTRGVSFAKIRRRCRSQRSVGSRHSCRGSRGSVRRSRPDIASPSQARRTGGNRITPLDVGTLESTAVIVNRASSLHSWRTHTDSVDHGITSGRRTVPVVQVQVYRSLDDDESLCNYCSDSDDSLKERSVRSLNVVESCTPTTPLSMSPPTARRGWPSAFNPFSSHPSSPQHPVHLPPINHGVVTIEQLPLPSC